MSTPVDAVLHRSNRAPFGQRAAASVIDSLLFLVALIALGAILVVLVEALPREEPQSCLHAPSGQRGLCEPLTGGAVAVILTTAVLFLLACLYVWSGELVGRRGVTPGRRLMGIRVVDVSTAQPIGVGRGIGRFLVTIPLGFCFLGTLIDILWMLRDPESQTLHDKAVGSVVVRRGPTGGG